MSLIWCCLVRAGVAEEAATSAIDGAFGARLGTRATTLGVEPPTVGDVNAMAYFEPVNPYPDFDRDRYEADITPITHLIYGIQAGASFFEDSNRMKIFEDVREKLTQKYGAPEHDSLFDVDHTRDDERLIWRRGKRLVALTRQGLDVRVTYLDLFLGFKAHEEAEAIRRAKPAEEVKSGF